MADGAAGESATTIVVRASTRADELRETLEQMIVEGKLSPGERLDEMELARRFGVSRTPVREAIKSLVATGLAEVRGRQGVSVTSLTIPALIEMFDVMAALEGLCARFAARRASLAEKAEMRRVHAELEQCYERRDPEEFYRVNAQFHDVLYRAAHTHFIADQTIQLRRRLAPYRLRVTYQPGRMFGTLKEHRTIIEAIEAGDSVAAQAAAITHVQLLGDQLADFIAALPAETSAVK